ncbi:MAG: leucine-rich repeat protein, partial [Clostridia bacterium]
MRKLKNITAALVVVFCFCALFVACAARDEGIDRGKNYAIVFESNGGSSVASISFADLSGVSAIEPEKDGYIFAGWFVDNETFKTELTLSYIKANLVQKELKAYAKWVTIDECFAFAFTDNTQSTYKISRKENATVPSKLVLPSEYNGKSVVEIGEMAFYNCNTLTSVTIPTSVISIGFLAFYGCDKMTNIAVENGNSNYQSIDGNLYSKDCKTLIQYAIGKTAAEFTIPTNVTNIGNDAFYNCKRLT